MKDLPIIEQIANEKERRGISIAELSRRTGVPYHRIRRAFAEGKPMRYEDAAAVAEELEMELK